jgi:hypothetical protein
MFLTQSKVLSILFVTHNNPMHIIPKILLSTTMIAIGYGAIAQPVQAFSFTTTPSALIDSPDGSPTPKEFTFIVNGVTAAPSYTYSLNLNLTHADLSELEGYLVNNTSGRTLNLFATLSGSNLVNTTFIDGQPIISSGTASYTSIFGFAPENNGFIETPSLVATTFSDFNDGTSPNTTWTLRFYDSANLNVGNLTSATLDVNPTAVPFEFDGTTGMLVVGGVFALKHWYKKRKDK